MAGEKGHLVVRSAKMSEVGMHLRTLLLVSAALAVAYLCRVSRHDYHCLESAWEVAVVEQGSRQAASVVVAVVQWVSDIVVAEPYL